MLRNILKRSLLPGVVCLLLLAVAGESQAQRVIRGGGYYNGYNRGYYGGYNRSYYGNGYYNRGYYNNYYQPGVGVYVNPGIGLGVGVGTSPYYSSYGRPYYNNNYTPAPTYVYPTTPYYYTN